MDCLELFAGGGGAALGLHAAGLRCLARIEWDTDACATLRAAIGAGFLDAAETICGDVRDVSLYVHHAGHVDFMWASPPCQAWSSAGKRLGARDDRNLWPATWAAIDAARPRWLVAENVAGMLHHRGDCEGKGDPADCPACWFHRVNMPEIARRFAWCGWAVLDSADYGVPQSRQRVYIVAGPGPIRWPAPTHADPAIAAQVGLFGQRLLPWVSVREALGLRDDETCWGAGSRGHGMAEWAPRDVSGTVSGTVSGMSSSTAAHYIRCEQTGAVATTVDDVSPMVGRAGHIYLWAHDPGTRAGRTVDRPVRRTTVAENMALMAWPASYPVQGTSTEQYRIVGNGCTPPVVEALARAVVEAEARECRRHVEGVAS